MFYHVFAEAAGYFIPPGDCDIQTEEDLLERYCIRYLQKKTINVGGANLESKDIYKLIIYQSDVSSTIIVRSAPAIIQQKRHGREYDALRKSEIADNISSQIMRLAYERIHGNIKENDPLPAIPVINISDSTFNNSPVTGNMNNSTYINTVNEAAKTEIEGWLRQITAELEKNNIQNEELTSAVETLRAVLQVPKPSGIITKAAVEAIKSIGYGVISSAAWEYFMTHPPI